MKRLDNPLRILDDTVETARFVCWVHQESGEIFMATRRQAASNTARRTADAAASTATGGAFTMKNFFKKVSNDWTLHQTQALSYSLIGALVPMAILLLAIVGFILNGLDHHAYTQLINHLGSSSGQLQASRC
jgi:hypothetical protein